MVHRAETTMLAVAREVDATEVPEEDSRIYTWISPTLMFRSL